LASPHLAVLFVELLLLGHHGLWHALVLAVHREKKRVYGRAQGP
jgi:hypothetical protein